MISAAHSSGESVSFVDLITRLAMGWACWVNTCSGIGIGPASSALFDDKVIQTGSMGGSFRDGAATAIPMAAAAAMEDNLWWGHWQAG